MTESGARLEPLYDRAAISEAVGRIGALVSANHPEGVVLVGVLKGALLFLADLVREVTVPVQVDFIALSRFAPDSGRVRIVHDLQIDVTDRDVVLVDAIVDTGLTLAYLARALEARGPRSVSACALLDRSVRRIVPHRIDYRGHEVDDSFLVGYGFHVEGRYQNLPEVFCLVPDIPGNTGGNLAQKEARA